MIGTVFFKRLTNCFRSHRVIMFLLPVRIIKRLASDVINEGFRFNSSNMLRPWQNSKADKPYSGIFKNYLDFGIKFIFHFPLSEILLHQTVKQQLRLIQCFLHNSLKFGVSWILSSIIFIISLFKLIFKIEFIRFLYCQELRPELEGSDSGGSRWSCE